MTRQPCTDLPLDDLPTWTFEATMAERASVAVCRRSHTLAVYRVKPGGGLSRLQRRRRTEHDYADYLGEIAGRLLAGV
jgi:hypothetical protein